jgi:NADH-ubiquinone/plastoquinone oxidoreductase chain 4L
LQDLKRIKDYHDKFGFLFIYFSCTFYGWPCCYDSKKEYSSYHFVAYSKFVTNNLDGHIFSLFIIVVAAAEAAVGLAIVIRFFQIKETIHIDEATQLRN